MSKKYISDHEGRKIDEKINYVDKTLPVKLSSIDNDIAELQMEKADKRSALTKTEMDNHKRAILLDHPDGSVTDEKIGNRTVDNPETENSTVSGYLTTLFNMFSLAIRNIKDNKVDKIAGKGLSTEDYTTDEKNKLAGIESGANKYTHPANHPPSIITQDEDNRFVSDEQIEDWNGNKAYTDQQIADNITPLQGQMQTVQDDISSLSENKADLSNGKVPKEQLPYYNNSPTLYAGETPLYGTTIVDIDDEGNPVIREDGSGDYLLHLTVLGMPMLRYIGNAVKDSVTGIKYVFTITDGTVILQAIN